MRLLDGEIELRRGRRCGQFTLVPWLNRARQYYHRDWIRQNALAQQQCCSANNKNSSVVPSCPAISPGQVIPPRHANLPPNMPRTRDLGFQPRRLLLPDKSDYVKL
jgi:hypothetical protein